MPDTVEASDLVDLEALRAALQRLKTFPLPVETRVALEVAILKADRLVKIPASQSGQNRLDALYRLSQVIGSSLDLDEVLLQVMDAVIDLTGAERGFLMLLNPDTGELDLRISRNIQRTNLSRKDMKVSRTVIQTVLQSGEGIVSTDAQDDPRFAGQDSIVFFSLRSVMCAPLRAHGQVTGVIYVDNRTRVGIFTRADLELLGALAAPAAIAIENAALYTRTDQALAARVAELEILTQIDRELTAHLDFDRVAEITRQWAISQTGAQRCYFIRREKNASLRLIGLDEGLSNPTLHNTLIQAVRTAIEVGDAQNFEPVKKSPARLVVPVDCSEGSLCALVVERAEPFGDPAVLFLKRLAARAEAALENARLYRAVQDANSAKTKFVSLVSHELRTPMTSIKGYTDLLRQGAVGPVNEMQVNFLNIIRNNVERMTALVSDLSDISHIENGRLKLNRSLIQLTDAIQDTAISIQHRLEAKQQTITFEIPAQLPPVYADPNRLVQVLTNLINNANKYTPEGGKVVVRAQESGNSVRVEVQDSGVGISEADQRMLFTQFFRSESDAVREQQGWGLGLNLTRSLVEMMGGEIGLQSQLGEGSTFWFTIPTQAPQA